MKIVCPACAAVYSVPDARLAPGRIVRCARCETDWTPVPEPDEAPAEAEPLAEDVPHHVEPLQAPIPEPEPAPPPPEPEPAAAPRRPNRALQLAWVTSLVAVAAMFWLAVSARETIMRAWPPAIRAYAALGLPGPGSGTR